MRKENSDLALKIVVGFALIAILGFFVWWIDEFLHAGVINDPEPESNACTLEAMQCPDGVTYVEQTGPNCEFEACPGEDSKRTLPPVEQKSGACVDKCGDGVCQEVVCMGSSCPCSESAISSESNYCPQDCKGDDPQSGMMYGQ